MRGDWDVVCLCHVRNPSQLTDPSAVRHLAHRHEHSLSQIIRIGSYVWLSDVDCVPLEVWPEVMTSEQSFTSCYRTGRELGKLGELLNLSRKERLWRDS